LQNFPELKELSFVKSREVLHTIAKIIGKFRKTFVKPIAKNDNLFLTVVDQGFCTPPITKYDGLEIGCNPGKMIIEIGNVSGKYTSFTLNGKTLQAVCEELSAVLKNDFGVNEVIDSSVLDYVNEIHLDEQNAKDFLTQIVNFHTLLNSFKKRITSGISSQICLWPHHFDNAFKWFSGKKIDEEDEYMGIGISNGDETYTLPYIYVTFYPPLRKTNTLNIPEGAVLHDYGWTGIVLPYESISEWKTIDKQAELINSFFDGSFAAVTRAFSKR
jgi:uncharacterized protein DUF5996